ncbi:MAG: hypothetical protein CMG46_02795 [Candidatus Marinimicrobia bacterium]|nr:hypothetical protein [Candidatus Neomarinimicrobiota bacterium]
MIVVTIGGRFIISELNESQKKMINNHWVRKLFIFCAFFMATRDIYCAITLTILFVLIITELFHTEDKGQYIEEDTNQKIDNLILELNELKTNL